MINLPVYDYFNNGVFEYVPGVEELPFDGKERRFRPNPTISVKSVDDLVACACKDSDFVSKQIGENLDASHIMKVWRSYMPRVTPKVISIYQHEDRKLAGLNETICKVGAVMSDGQILFRGGSLEEGVQSTPFSTSLNPVVALTSHLRKWRARDLGYIALYCLKVQDPKTPVFVYRQKGNCSLGHEREVLFGSGAEVHINDTFTGNMFGSMPVRIYNATIS